MFGCSYDCFGCNRASDKTARAVGLVFILECTFVRIIACRIYVDRNFCKFYYGVCCVCKLEGVNMVKFHPTRIKITGFRDFGDCIKAYCWPKTDSLDTRTQKNDIFFNIKVTGFPVWDHALGCKFKSVESPTFAPPSTDQGRGSCLDFSIRHRKRDQQQET